MFNRSLAKRLFYFDRWVLVWFRNAFKRKCHFEASIVTGSTESCRRLHFQWRKFRQNGISASVGIQWAIAIPWHLYDDTGSYMWVLIPTPSRWPIEMDPNPLGSIVSSWYNVVHIQVNVLTAQKHPVWAKLLVRIGQYHSNVPVMTYFKKF